MRIDKENFETTNCIVCGVDDTDKLSKKGQFGLPAHVVICRQCGLTYLNPRWNKAKITSFYENEYDSYYRPNMVNKPKSNVYMPLYKRLEAENIQLKSMRNILDIGSGDGKNLEYIIEKLPQAEFYAIEPSPQCRSALEAINVKILGTDAEADYDSKYQGYFDLIIMRHVLEHFANPITLLEKVKTLLKDDGVLYIAVPNSLKFGEQELLHHWFRSVHSYYFNVHTIKNVFRKAGVAIVWIADGDEYNEMELLALVRKGNYEEVVINKEHYTLQKDLFKQKLKKEKSTIVQLRRWWSIKRSKDQV